MEPGIHPQSPDLTMQQDRSIRLFSYLKELCALKSPQNKDCDNYEQVFWLEDLPRHKLCDSALWSLTDESVTGNAASSKSWIKIERPKMEGPPSPSVDLEPWVITEELYDSSLERPNLEDQIPREELSEETEVANPDEMVSLDQFPELVDEWNKYIEQHWKPWAVKDRELQTIQNAWNELFTMYQRQDKLGEQFEIIMGAGLLHWKSPNSQIIRRHLLTARARIEFDRFRGVVKVEAGTEFEQMALEYLMLETLDRPKPNDLTAIEAEVAALADEPWQAGKLFSILKSLAHSLPTSGDFENTFSRRSTPGEKPLVILAPAIIMRKRTRRDFETFYAQMIEQVKRGIPLPENILRIVEIIEDSRDGHHGTRIPSQSQGTDGALSDNETYFPLPANEEQKRIIHKVENRQGVLVQGPPGTGKSHTIANLITHYLAHGKRILVTSETPRALKVLQDKLPKSIQSLCVVWLGADRDSQVAMENAVQSITTKKANRDEQQAAQITKELLEKLDQERRKQAKCRNEIRSRREKDSYLHSKINETYSGTLERIATQLSDEKTTHGWFLDRPNQNSKSPLTSSELLRLKELNTAIPESARQELRLRLAALENLVSPSEFERITDAESNAKQSHEESQMGRSYQGYSKLGTLNTAERETFLQTLDALVQRFVNLTASYHDWAKRAAREIAADNDSYWKRVFDETLNKLEKLDSVTSRHPNLTASPFDGYDISTARQLVENLRRHLQAGGRMGFWIIRSKPVKDALPLLRKVRINGIEVTDLESAIKLESWLESQEILQSLGRLWSPITTVGALDIQTASSIYRDLLKPIESALEMHTVLKRVQFFVAKCHGLRAPVYHELNDVQLLQNAVTAFNAQENYSSAQQQIFPLEQYLFEQFKSQSAHITTENLLEAVRHRNQALYRSNWERLEGLHQSANQLSILKSLLKRFQECAPRTYESYLASPNDPSWEFRFQNWDPAWAWGATLGWLQEMNNHGKTESLQEQLNESRSLEAKLIVEIAEQKAWTACIQRIGETERMALVGWQQAVKKIRGGTGKYVETHKEDARKNLERCRAAIPAWVMPLYQVVSMVRAVPEQFDIVIVDEASQSGPEAILLNYLSKKMIVVGDDMQITPMNVGIDRSAVEYLRRKYLEDIPHQDSLDLNGSLFSQAELRFPDRIRLTEHFRCMPEIIQFSNNLSYANQPLIPLRTQETNQLEPALKPIFVSDGYKKGTSNSAYNPAEATKIVDCIAECCEDPRYKNKTFGVIVMRSSKRHVDLITNLLYKAVGAAEMDKRQLVCGFPYDFQGDERDVIFVSLLDAPESTEEILRFDGKDQDTARRYNVAASRARDQLWVFHSMPLSQLQAGDYRHRLIDYCHNPRIENANPDIPIEQILKMPRHISPPEPFDSWLEVDIYHRIHQRGFRIHPQYKVANYRIDLVVTGLRGKLAVECDGDAWHGSDRHDADDARQRNLERCGWQFVRIRGSEFRLDPEAALENLWETLQRKGICANSAEDAYASMKLENDQSQPSANAEIDDLDEDVETETEVFEQAQTDTNEVENADSHPAQSQIEERLAGSLSFSRTRQKAAESVSSAIIQSSIIKVLQHSPNNTCTQKSIASKVLKELQIRTRGKPRLAFQNRINTALRILVNQGRIEKYKAKNHRLRLLSHDQQNLKI